MRKSPPRNPPNGTISNSENMKKPTIKISFSGHNMAVILGFTICPPRIAADTAGTSFAKLKTLFSPWRTNRPRRLLFSRNQKHYSPLWRTRRTGGGHLFLPILSANFSMLMRAQSFGGRGGRYFPYRDPLRAHTHTLGHSIGIDRPPCPPTKPTT